MDWSLKNMINMINKMDDDKKKNQLQWNKEFPPDIEVNIVEDDNMKTTYGIWKVPGGNIFIIPKSKNGYHPERRINIDEKIVDAIRSMK
ncbi:MAG: hypothetical protein QQN41_08215 [Nitrosopumilus sp.]